MRVDQRACTQAALQAGSVDEAHWTAMLQSHTQSHDVFDVVKAHGGGGLRGENGVRKEVL